MKRRKVRMLCYAAAGAVDAATAPFIVVDIIIDSNIVLVVPFAEPLPLLLLLLQGKGNILKRHKNWKMKLLRCQP